MGVDLRALYEAVSFGKAQIVRQLVQQAVDEDVPPHEVLNNYMVPALQEVGARFERGEAFVPEMLIAARAMQVGVGILRPVMVSGGGKPMGKVLIGTVQGDLHDIGKNLVAMLLQGAGFDVVDLGTDVPADKFIEAVRLHSPDVVGLSALLTSTMLKMREVINGLENNGLRGQVKVMLGGAPLSAKVADEFGADAYGRTAFDAVSLVQQWVS